MSSEGPQAKGSWGVQRGLLPQGLAAGLSGDSTGARGLTTKTLEFAGSPCPAIPEQDL
jgi:hypothetical protein